MAGIGFPPHFSFGGETKKEEVKKSQTLKQEAAQQFEESVGFEIEGS